jgi:hypothetical protein
LKFEKIHQKKLKGREIDIPIRDEKTNLGGDFKSRNRPSRGKSTSKVKKPGAANTVRKDERERKKKKEGLFENSEV